MLRKEPIEFLRIYSKGGLYILLKENQRGEEQMI